MSGFSSNRCASGVFEGIQKAFISCKAVTLTVGQCCMDVYSLLRVGCKHGLCCRGCFSKDLREQCCLTLRACTSSAHMAVGKTQECPECSDS